MEFIAGFFIGGAVASIVSRYLAVKTFRMVLRAIHAGKAFPDESGNVGWVNK